MDRLQYEKMYGLEETDWWFVGRRRIIGTLIEKMFDGRNDISSLDEGCGTGIFLDYLKRFGRATGIDSSEIALEYAKRRGNSDVVLGDICDLPFEDGKFDLVTVMGVLYHKEVKSDEQAVRESFRVLKKGGILIIDEAAYKFLWSKHNERVSGARRYTREELTAIMKKAGFSVVKASYWNILMFPVVCLFVACENIFFRKQKDLIKLGKTPHILNGILKHYIYAEAFLMRYIDLPFGLSVVVVGRKEN